MKSVSQQNYQFDSERESEHNSYYSKFNKTKQTIDMTKCQSRDEWKKIFKMFDPDGDGFIKPRELADFLEERGICDSSTAMCWFFDIDKDGDQKISYDEFVEEVFKKPRCQALAEIFEKADKDGSGQLSREELENACIEAGLTDKNSLEKGFAKADRDGSGFVDKDEFIAYMNGTY